MDEIELPGYHRPMFRTLLERTSRRVTLTQAGAVLLEQGRIAVEEASAAVERARRKGTQACRLTVAVKPGTATELLNKIMQRCAQNPAVPEVHILFGTLADPPPRSAGAPPTSRSCSATSAAWTELRRGPADRHRLPAGELRRADLAGVDAALGGRPTRPPRLLDRCRHPSPARISTPDAPGPEINDISQLRTPSRQRRRLRADLRRDQHRAADLVFVPVSDLSPSEVVAAWPDTSRSRAVAGFVRAAVEVAASHASAPLAEAIATDSAAVVRARGRGSTGIPVRMVA